MGFLTPKAPAVIAQKPAATVDDDSIRRAGEEEALRLKARRDGTDTNLTANSNKRRVGGLASALRKKVGG